MTKNNSAGDVAETLSAPLGDMIASIGRGVAEAQSAIDAKTIESFKRMYSGDDAILDEMRKIGYMPTWYKIPELEAEITMSLSIGGQSETAGPDGPVGGPGGVKLYAAPMDASYANKYDFRFEAASKIRFKVVAAPPSPEAVDMKVVPGLVNKKFEQAKTLLEELGIPFRLEDQNIAPSEGSKVSAITPSAGTILARGQAIVLRF